MNFFYNVIPLENKGYSDFIPVDFGMEKNYPSHAFGPNIREYYLIHFVLEGKGVFINPKQEYTLEKGDAFLIRPGEVCTYKADNDEPWTYIWIGFNGNMSNRFDNVSDVFKYDEIITEEFKIAYEENNLVEEQLASILFKLYRSLFKNKISSNPINQAIGYINVYYANNLKIEDLADMLHLNRKYLSRAFKKKTGYTIQQYMLKKRMNEGKKLLDMGYNVKETAILLGYSDSFAFSKAFKKACSVSPKDYINKS